MKGKARKVHEHGVPLSPAAKAIIDGLPNLGPYVFTHDGKKPISGFSTSKAKFNGEVLALLRKRDPEAKQLPNWTLHDLRRTARTLMSRAGIEADIAERVLAHKIGGIRETYDRWSYLPEKRHALEALAAQIGRIIAPPTANVASLDERRTRDSRQ
jgi:integrase